VHLQLDELGPGIGGGAAREDLADLDEMMVGHRGLDEEAEHHERQSRR
jgi:hypothetical protein